MIAIIDYKAGNVASVKNALNKLGFSCVVTNNEDEILSASGVVFPGQGRAGMAMRQLKKQKLISVLQRVNVPFLGICLGMQLLTGFSEEDETNCLGLIDGKCKLFPSALRVPHVGWNKVNLVADSALFEGIKDGEFFYFVHSYYVDNCSNSAFALTSYGFNFVSAFQKNNFYGLQFHPEKSGEAGMKVLSNFCKLCF